MMQDAAAIFTESAGCRTDLTVSTAAVTRKQSSIKPEPRLSLLHAEELLYLCHAVAHKLDWDCDLILVVWVLQGCVRIHEFILIQNGPA